MKGTPHHQTFTLNLNPEVEKAARAAPCGPLNFLRRRIAARLRSLLGSDVRWWACLEENDALRLHLHGEIECAPAELPAVRKALRQAGGEWAANRQFQVITKPIPDVRWSSYCAKNLNLATEQRRRLMARYGCTKPWHVASFSGPAFTMSNTLRDDAKAKLRALSATSRKVGRGTNALGIAPQFGTDSEVRAAERQR